MHGTNLRLLRSSLQPSRHNSSSSSNSRCLPAPNLLRQRLQLPKSSNSPSSSNSSSRAARLWHQSRQGSPQLLHHLL